jgi:hypothetical protein
VQCVVPAIASQDLGVGRLGTIEIAAVVQASRVVE